MAKAAPKKLEDAVTIAGSHRDERLRALKAGVEAFRRNPGLAARLRDTLPAAASVAETLPHLSAAAGQRLLLFAGQHPIVPFDPAHARVAVRLGLGMQSEGAARPRAALDEFAAALSTDVDLIRRAALYFLHHGLTTCTEFDPHCTVCPLLDRCAEGRNLAAAR
jgi:endonuclease III